MILILYNSAPATYLSKPLGGSSTSNRVLEFTRALSAHYGELRVVLYSTEPGVDIPAPWEFRTGSALDESGLIALVREYADSESAELIVAHYDQPFLNCELAIRTIDRHREFNAEFTFSDGYPKGLGVEVISGRAVTHLSTLAKDGATLERPPVFEIVMRDINRLDVETVLSKHDNRLLRLSLSVSELPDLVLCERLTPNAPESIDEWELHVQRTRPDHRTRPRYVSIQVLEQEVQRLSYSPYPLVRRDVTEQGAVMELQDFQNIVEKLRGFSPHAWVHLSLWGEVALHPQVMELVEAVLSEPSMRLLLETSGIGWQPDARKQLFSCSDRRLALVLGLDSNDPEIYRAVRGPGFEEAQAFAHEAVEALGSRAYVQAVRSEQTEPALDAFYREWKEVTDQIVIQKYDHFSGRIPQIRIGDIRPLDRFPCWHLQRDLAIQVDGTVVLCKEDFRSEQALGNAITGSLESAWEAGQARHRDHVNGIYDGICQECDEYYTFSF